MNAQGSDAVYERQMARDLAAAMNEERFVLLLWVYSLSPHHVVHPPPLGHGQFLYPLGQRMRVLVT